MVGGEVVWFLLVLAGMKEEKYVLVFFKEGSWGDGVLRVWESGCLEKGEK